MVVRPLAERVSGGVGAVPVSGHHVWGRHAPLLVLPFSEAALLDPLNSSILHGAAELGWLFVGLEARTIGGWEHISVVSLGGREPRGCPGGSVP